MLKKINLLLLALMLMSVSLTAQALDFSKIDQLIFFGDSLTDSGFNDLFPEPNPGKAPTFTTFGGYVWSQYLARDLKGFVLPVYPGPNPADTITNNQFFPGPPYFSSGTKTGIDFAAGGSTTNSTGNGFPAPSLIQQVTAYLSTAPARLDPNNLYFVWSGANDILMLLQAPTIPTELELLTTANNAAINVGRAVAMLSARGARNIVVLALPNVGLTPAIELFAIGSNMPGLIPAMKNVSFTYNSMLNRELGKVIRQYGTHILYFDTYLLLDQVIQATMAGQPYVVDGQSFQFVNFTLPVCGLVPAILCPPGTPPGFMFADLIHPTDESHRLLSLAVEVALAHWNPTGGDDNNAFIRKIV